MRFTFASALCLAATAIAAPLQARQSSTTCGSNYYSASKVNNALNQGLNYYEADEEVGSGGYPHTYNSE